MCSPDPILISSEMLALSNEWLETREVTLGARRKMLLELQRLVARVDAVAHLRERLDSGRVRLADAIAELDSALAIPFSPLASQTRVGAGVASAAVCTVDAPAFDVAARFLLVASKSALFPLDSTLSNTHSLYVHLSIA